MNNLIPMDKAAEMLGMSVDQLSELRSNNEIFGYRDGANWKFKMNELERVANNMDIKLNLSGAADKLSDSMGSLGSLGSLADSADELKLEDDESELSFDFSDSADDLIVDDNDSSDMIGQDSSGGSFDSSSSMDDEDSSIEILQKPLAERALEAGGAAAGGLAAAAGGLAAAAGLTGGDPKDEGGSSSIKLDDSGVDIFDSSNALDDEEALSFGSSSIRLAADSSKSGKNLTGSDTGDLLDDEPAKADSPSGTGKMLAGDDDLLLSEDDLFADDLSLQDSGSFEDSAELSSDFEDSDLVLDDSDSSTEIVLEANDSGINLSPNDSGISLDEEILELGGSDIDSLELPEDDDMIMLEEAADADAATMMQEDDFNLTPLEEAPEDESSGSQVIALEDSEIYEDESSATILADSDDMVAQPAMMDDSMGMAAGAAGAVQYQGMDTGAAPMVAPTSVAQIPEAPFSIWSILSLALVSMMLVLGGMIAYNISQNLWLPEDRVISSGLLNTILETLGWT